MTLFRLLLVLMAAVLAIYTAIVISGHGMGLLPVFFGDMSRLGWPGQFNLDFMFMLTLSALWAAWRNGFSGQGLVLALLAFFFGAMFLTLYLLLLSYRTGGDPRRMLLGDGRAD